MPTEKSEQEKFLEGVKEESILDKPLNLEPEKAGDEKPNEAVADDELGEAKRRRERRLMEKLQAEKEANIALAARLEAITEVQKFRSESEPAGSLKLIERIYGNNSPEAQEATRLLQDALSGVKEEAKREAIEAFREEQAKSQQAVKSEERELDAYIEEMEDTYNVSFSKEMEQSYFKLMEKLSPKDREGNIIEYADPHSVYEIFSEKLSQNKDSRAKNLAARGITNSAGTQNNTLQADAGRQFLKDAGII